MLPELPVLEVSLKEKGKVLQLAISDNGIGIPKDELKNIFRKFYRIPTGNIHDVKGFGLGLDYVSKIVKAHHWKIGVDGNRHGGSTFTLFIMRNE